MDNSVASQLCFISLRYTSIVHILLLFFKVKNIVSKYCKYCIFIISLISTIFFQYSYLCKPFILLLLSRGVVWRRWCGSADAWAETECWHLIIDALHTLGWLGDSSSSSSSGFHPVINSNGHIRRLPWCVGKGVRPHAFHPKQFAHILWWNWCFCSFWPMARVFQLFVHSMSLI